MKNKNILIFFTDQQRTDTLGFRNPLCRTPNIDSLLETGISFDRCLTPSPLCTPARTAVFTGMYPHQIPGIAPQNGTCTVCDVYSQHDKHMQTNDYTANWTPELPRLLERQGYDVSYAGKWHLGNACIHDWFPNACGYDTKEYSRWCKEQGLSDGWAFNDMSIRSERAPHMSTPQSAELHVPPQFHGDVRITDMTIEHIKNRDKKKPFFTVCAVNGPHPPFKVPEPYLSYYKDIAEKIPCPDNFVQNGNIPKYLRESYQHFLAVDYSSKWEVWQQSIAAYWGLTRLIDEQLGRVMNCLREEGILDDTIVIYISDHGEMMGAHELFKKNEAFEEALRVPMIVSAAGIPHGVRSNYPASLLDMVPTVLDMAGVSYDPNHFEGCSLYPAIKGEKTEQKRLLFSEHRPLGLFHRARSWRMVTDNHYKYIWTNGQLEQLYDLEKDPVEQNNICAEQKEKADYYRRALCMWAIRTDDPMADTMIEQIGTPILLQGE